MPGRFAINVFVLQWIGSLKIQDNAELGREMVWKWHENGADEQQKTTPSHAQSKPCLNHIRRRTQIFQLPK